MRIAIFGAGAIGGFLGAKLAAAGADVTFIARGPHLAAMQAAAAHRPQVIACLTHGIVHLFKAGIVSYAREQRWCLRLVDAEQAVSPGVTLQRLDGEGQVEDCKGKKMLTIDITIFFIPAQPPWIDAG